jgi:hypothetical protein
MSGLRGIYLIAGVTALLAFGAVLGGSAGEVSFVVAVVLMPAALLLLARQGRPMAGAAIAAAVILLTVGGGFGWLLILRGQPPIASEWFALPVALVVQIAIALVPLVVLGVLFARSFDRFRPSKKSLEAIRSLSDADS